MDTEHTSDLARPAAPGQASTPAPGSGQAVQDFLTLELAARVLGTGPQGVVVLAAQAGLELRRVSRAGRTLTGLSRAEVEGLRIGLEGPPATPAEADLRARLLQAERALEEARADGELAQEACQRLARAVTEAEATHARLCELREELRGLRAELARRDEHERALEARVTAEQQRGEQALAEERRGSRALRAEARRLGRDLCAAGERIGALEKQLRTAEGLEAASKSYVDQLETKLRAATHTIAHLRRQAPVPRRRSA